MKKVCVFFSLMLVLSLGFGLQAWAAVPGDVAEDAWYSEAVTYVVVNGIMIGTGEDVFEPEGVVNRASAYQSLYNISEAADVSGASYSDVTEEDWYAPAALWAKAYGLYEPDIFDGGAAVTLPELVDLFYDYGVLSGLIDPETYQDASAFEESIALVDSSVSAANYVQRGELARMHYRFGTSQYEAQTDGTVTVVDKYGNITLDLVAQNLFLAGFELGDVLTVSLDPPSVAGNVVLAAPFCTSYSDVDTGELVVRAPGGVISENIIIAINMGNLAETYGVTEGTPISLSVSEAGGYADEYELRQLERSNDREDYASDQIFANFRMVDLGSIAEGVLYRSSSPVNNEIGRAAYADNFAKEAEIVTVINLADSLAELEGYFAEEDFNSPYYQELFDNGQVVYLAMGVDFSADDFKAKLKTGLEFLINNEGPYLIHCNEGKDRAGYVSAVLSALMGATAEEIKADYLVTYLNYYGIVYNSEQYHRIGESNILESMRNIAGLEKGADLAEVDLTVAAEQYLEGIGLSTDQISLLKDKLAGN